MATFQRYLTSVRARIQETSPDEVRARPPRFLVDLRDREEFMQGFIPGAQWIPRSKLEMRVEEILPDKDGDIVLYCASGIGSALAAGFMQEVGYTRVRSMSGGVRAWQGSGLPVEKPFVLTDGQRSRYARHILLPEVGEAGQAALLQAKVLLIGAGGLGSPSALYLTAAGVGTLGLVDDDVVEASNLQRQVMHNTTRVGEAKVDSASQTITELNPDVKVIKHRLRMTSHNVLDVIRGYDVIVDGSDNFPTRYLLNDAAVKLRKPVIHASIFRFEGQLTTFLPYEGPCYRCLFSVPPPPGMAPSCNEAGVLGVLPGVMGLLQATECIKLILKIGRPLVGRILVYDALEAELRELKLKQNPRCPVCSDPEKPIDLVDLEAVCTLPAAAPT